MTFPSWSALRRLRKLSIGKRRGEDIVHIWFQNLNDRPKNHHWLNFRGSLGRSWEKQWFKYEFCTGPACRFTFDVFKGKTKFAIGLGFFTIYLTVYGLTIPFLRKGDSYNEWGREYGFYWFEWTFWAFFGRDPMGSSSKDPWYYQIVWHPLDTLFGKTKYFEDERMKNYSPILFEFRGRQFQMDKIRLTNAYWFKTRIPFAIWHRKIERMHLDIKKPPGFAGKGENDYDCDDDATYGTCQRYLGPKVSWENHDAIFDYCCRTYCDDVMKSIKRYGRSSDDKANKDETGYVYIGRQKNPDDPQACAVLSEAPPCP